MPKQIPKNGIPACRTCWSTTTRLSATAGSPGPLEKNTASGFSAVTCSKLVRAGTTCTRIPRSAIRRGVIALIPRSKATTVGAVGALPRRLRGWVNWVRTGSTTYASAVLTSSTRSAPAIGGRGEHPLQQRGRITLGGGQPDPHGPALAQVPGQRPGVDVGDRDDPLLRQLNPEGAPRAPARRRTRGVAHDVPRHPDPARLIVLVVPAGVPDVRRRGDHDLAAVARVGQRLLVTRHRGGEDRLSEHLALGPEGSAHEGPSVLQDHQRRPRHRLVERCVGRRRGHGGTGHEPSFPASQDRS